MPIHIRPATVADLDSIARISTACFQHDPASAVVYPERLASTEQDPYTTQFIWRKWRIASRIYDPSAAIFVAVEGDSPEDGEVVGYTLWDLPASGWEMDEETKEGFKLQGKDLVGPEAYDRTYPCVDHEIFGKAKKMIEEIGAKTFGEKGKDDVYYLSFLCVDPPHHRKGIGKQLLQWGIDKSASEEKDCFLISTPTGTRLYLANGFEDVGTTDLLGVPHKTMIIRNNPRWKQN